MNTPLPALIDWYETLSPANLGEIDRFYRPDLRFADPLHSLENSAALRALYQRMFEHLETPHFRIEHWAVTADQAFLVWRFAFGYRDRALSIEGSSHLQLAADGRIAYHRDYWDTAGGIYQHIPLLGALLRRLRKRLQ